MIYVNDLILDALYLIAAATPEGIMDNSKKKMALRWLNKMFAMQRAETSLLPFAVEINFSLTGGKRDYTIGVGSDNDVVTPVFADIQYLNIFQNGLQWPIEKRAYGQYQQYEQVSSITARPSYFYHIDGDISQTVFFDVAPDTNYLCRILGKKTEGQVDYQDNIDLPEFMYIYLSYQLASYLDDIYAMNQWTQKKEQHLQKSKAQIMAKSQKRARTTMSQPSISPSTGNQDAEAWRWMIR